MSIPSKILKQFSDILKIALFKYFNSAVLHSVFRNKLKFDDISVFKKDNAFCKKNYRPITTLPSMSKIFERLMMKQIEIYTQDFLSPLLCGFRECYSTKNVLRFVDSYKNVDTSRKTNSLWLQQRSSIIHL